MVEDDTQTQAGRAGVSVAEEALLHSVEYRFSGSSPGPSKAKRAHPRLNSGRPGEGRTRVLNAFGNPVKHYGDFDPGLMKGGFNQEGPIPEIIA